MPITLGSRPPASGDDPAALLLDCHGRIRRFSDLAGKLASAPPETAADEISQAARDVHRYFTVALPLHEQDEEITLSPVLRARSLPPAVESVLDAIPAEHRVIEQTLADLLPAWMQIALDPARLPETRGWLSRATFRLADLFSTHLEREEIHLFPVLQRIVPPDERARVRDEMRARRA